MARALLSLHCVAAITRRGHEYGDSGSEEPIDLGRAMDCRFDVFTPRVGWQLAGSTRAISPCNAKLQKNLLHRTREQGCASIFQAGTPVSPSGMLSSTDKEANGNAL